MKLLVMILFLMTSSLWAATEAKPGVSVTFDASALVPGFFVNSDNDVGLSLGYDLDEIQAVESAIAWNNGKHSYAHLTYTRAYERPEFYYGLGLVRKIEYGTKRVWNGFKRIGYWTTEATQTSRFFAKIPLGYQYKIDAISLYAEVSPLLQFSPQFSLDVDLTLGLRYRL